jgi:glycogen synthase
MNILYISNEYPPETGHGGIGTYTKHCAEGMAARGHNVRVLCRSESGEPSITAESGVWVQRIPAGSYPLPSQRFFFHVRKFCYHAVPDSLVRLAWAKKVYETYRHGLSEFEAPDIIEYPECGGEGYYFSEVRDIVKIVRLHTPWEMVRKLDDIRQPPCDRYLLSHIERSAARHASFLTSPTQALAAIVKRRWRLSCSVVIPNPIPSTDFTLSEGNDLLFLGRVEHRKGVHILIEAYSQLCRLVTPPPLRLVGKPYGKLQDGTEYGDFISRLIARVPLNGLIEWIKGAPYASVKTYLRQSSIALFPSIWENLSYACLEAMASGLAVIASHCGGFPEMIAHGETGVLVEPNNAPALTEALLKLIREPQLLKKIGANARDHIGKNYDTELICKRVETVYLDFLTRQTG